MPVTIQSPVITYTANGSVTSFAFPFRVIKQSDLYVYANGVQVSTGFTVSGINNPSGGNVVFTVAPANGTLIRLQRGTSLDRATDYVEGGQLASDTLDNDFDRIVMMIQDVSNLQMNEASDGTFDAEGKRIKNVADPVSNQDAVTKIYVDSLGAAVVANATTQATNAANSATAASTSATNAANSATSASTQATNALTYLNTFKGQYYGAFAAAPALDPLGNAITTGDLYFNTTDNLMKVYNGTGWQDVAPIYTNTNPSVSFVGATGNNQGAAAGLTGKVNIINSGSTGTADGVILPVAAAGLTITVLNVSAATIKVYPNTSGNIEANAANVAVSIAPGTRLVFIAANTTQWYAMTAVYA